MKKLGFQIFLIGLVIIVWVALFLILGRTLDTSDLWGLMVIGSAVITFFGFLCLHGNVDENGAFRESRIRLSITASLLIVYLVYFGSMVYLNVKIDAEGKIIADFAQDLLPTLTNLLMVTIPFYFGSSVAVEIAKFRTKKEKKDQESP